MLVTGHIGSQWCSKKNYNKLTRFWTQDKSKTWPHHALLAIYTGAPVQKPVSKSQSNAQGNAISDWLNHFPIALIINE